MNLGIMRAHAQQRWRDVTSLLVDEATWNRHINDARDEFLRMVPNLAVLDRKTTVTTVAAQETANLPVNFDEWGSIAAVRMRDSEDVLVAYAEPREAALEYYSDEQGRPEAYLVDGTALYLFPIPDGAYTLDVWLRSPLARLVNDSDEPTEPEAFHQAYVEGALERVAIDDEAIPIATYHRGRFLDIVQVARLDSPMTRSERYPVVVDDFYEGVGW